MKTTAEMNLNELVDYWTGQLILSIGRGDIRGTVAGILMSTMNDTARRMEKENVKGKKKQS